MNKKLTLLIAACLALPLSAAADDAHHGHATKNSTTAASGASASDAQNWTEGEVRKVDQSAQKITLRHGPIPNLDMPNMTMVFRVTDPAMLEQVQKGDKIRFTADKLNGAFTVTALEKP